MRLAFDGIFRDAVGMSKAEEWRPVVAADGYEVSSLGNVRSWVRKGRAGGRRTEPAMLKPGLTGKGYRFCIVAGRPRRVAHMVLESFVGPRPKRQVARHHPDDTKTNDSLANLSWGTGAQNYDDRRSQPHYRTSVGVLRPRLSSGEKANILMLLSLGATQADCARWFGRTEGGISTFRQREAAKAAPCDSARDAIA